MMQNLRAEVLGVDVANKSVYLQVPGCDSIAMVDAPPYWLVEAGDYVEVNMDGFITCQVTESTSYLCHEIPQEKKRRISDMEGWILTPGARGSQQSSNDIISPQQKPITSIQEIFKA